MSRPRLGDTGASWYPPRGGHICAHATEELKLGRFDARDKGQMELYLRWLDKHERQPGENPPLGLILCADRNEEQIELLELTDGSVRVASYLTELPPRELLERKLLESIARARTLAAGRGWALPDPDE